jgi:hypothetical protein
MESATRVGPFTYGASVAWMLPCAVLMVATSIVVYMFLAARGAFAPSFVCELEGPMRWSIALPLGLGAAGFAIGAVRAATPRITIAVVILLAAAIAGSQAVHLVYSARCAHPIDRDVG